MLAEDSLCHSRPFQKQMRFQPRSSSTRCPLPAPSQEQAEASLGFSPPLLGKIPARASLLLDNPGIWHPPGGAGLAVSEHRAPQCSPWESQTLGANLGNAVPVLPHVPQLSIPVLSNCFDPTKVTQKTITSRGPRPQAPSGSQNCGLSASISHKSVDFSVHTPGEGL